MASIKDLGDGRFRVVISAGFDENGKRIRKNVTITAPNITKAKHEAKILEGEMLKQKRERKWKQNHPEEMTFKQLADEFIDEIAREVKNGSKSPKTEEGYEGILRKRLMPYLGEVKLKNIDKKRIKRCLDALGADVKDGGIISGGYSPQSIRHSYTVLQTVLNFAIEEEYISKNACSQIKTPVVKKTKIIEYDKTIVGNILSHLNKVEIMQRVCFLIAIETGCRRSEIMGLEWKDFDTENKVMTVCRTRHATSKRGICTRKILKNGSREKVIAYSDELNQVLLRYKEEQERCKSLWRDEYKDADRLFVEKDGRIIDPRKASYWFKDFQEGAGIKKVIRLHDLRHLHISMLILNGMDVISVAKRAGHSSPKTTLEVYSHAYREVDRRPTEYVRREYYKQSDAEEKLQ